MALPVRLDYHGALGIMCLGPVVTADKCVFAGKGEQRLYKGLL